MTANSPQNIYANQLLTLAILNRGEVYGFHYYTNEADRVRVIALKQGISNPDVIFSVLIRCAELEINGHPNSHIHDELVDSWKKSAKGKGR